MAAFALDDGKDVGVHVAHDLGCVAGRDLVDDVGFHLQPADPVAASVRDDARALELGGRDELATVLAQDDVAAVVGLADAQFAQQRQHARLHILGVDRLLEHLVELGVLLQDRAGLVGVSQVQRAGARKQVLDVVGGKPHGRGSLYLSFKGMAWRGGTRRRRPE